MFVEGFDCLIARVLPVAELQHLFFFLAMFILNYAGHCELTAI